MCYSIYRLLVLGFCVTQDTEILWHGMNCCIKFMHILICHWVYVASMKYCGCLTGWWFLDGLQKYRLGKQLHREGGHESTKGGMYHTALFLIKPSPKWFVPLLYVLILSGKSYLQYVSSLQRRFSTFQFQDLQSISSTLFHTVSPNVFFWPLL